jgi:hypothetical protein
MEFHQFIAEQKLQISIIEDSFVVIPGSFNPLHDAHRRFFDNAPKNYGNSWRKVVAVFELSIHRKDKEFLPFEEMAKRIEQFRGYAPVWVTNACYFIEKAGLSIPICPFFEIGFDTAERLISDHGVIGVQGIDAKFTVNPREINGKLWTIDDLKVQFGITPYNMHPSLTVYDTVGISSTGIRNGVK